MKNIIERLKNIAQRLHLLPQQYEQNELSTIISEIEMIKTKLEEQNNLYLRAMIDTFPLVIWIGNKNGEREYFNQAWLKFTGANSGEKINQLWNKYLHPEDEKKCLKQSLLAWQKQESFVIEYRLKKADGNYGYILDNAIPIYTAKGEFNGYIGGCIDITKYKQVETDLQTAKEQLKAVLNAVPGFVSWVDNQGIYQGVNSRLANAFNLQPEDFIGQELGFLQNSPEFAQFMRQFLANSTLAESKIIHAGQKYFLIVGEKYNHGKNAVSVGIDISDHKQTEGELVKSEAKFRALVNAMPDLLIRMNENGTYLDFIPAKNFATSMPYNDMIGRNVYDVFSQEFADQSIYGIQKALTTNELQIYEYQITLDDGQIAEQEARICPLQEHEKEVLIIIRDISDRKLIENTLQKMNNELENRVEERTVELNETITQLQQEIITRKQVETLNNLLAIAIEQAGDGIEITDQEGKIEYFNSAAQKITGYTTQEVIGKTQAQLFRSNKHEGNFYQEMWQTINQGQIWRGSYFGQRKDGSIYPQDVTISPVFNEEGNIIHFVVSRRDITAQKQAEEALSKQQRQFKALLNNIPDMAWLKDQESRFIAVNEPFGKACGFTPEDLIDKTDYDVWEPDLARKYLADDQKVMTSRQRLLVEEIIKDSSGKIYWFETVKTPIFNELNQVIGTTGIARDITERKRSEEKIKASLKEKEVLLKEIHHRVKNNLQVTSSLLKLQSVYINDSKVLSMFTDSYNRIKVMALIHEKLYQAQDLARINAMDYIPNLAENLLRSYNVHNAIKLQINVDEIWLDVDTAIPCGLIINELVSNSLKYAFPSLVKECIITIKFHHTDHHYLQLTIADNGLGVPENFNFRETESLGLQLVCNLTEQLGGEIELQSDHGTLYQITFPTQK